MYEWPDELEYDYDKLNDVIDLLYYDSSLASAISKQIEVLKSLEEHIKKYNPPEDVIELLTERVLENVYEIASRVCSERENTESFNENLVYSETGKFLDFVSKKHKKAYRKVCSIEPYNVLAEWFKK